MKYLLSFFAAVFLLVSCSTATQVSDKAEVGVKEMVKDPETTLVDVRVPEQFADKTANGAVNIPLATILDNIDFFRKQKNIVVFCNSGKQAGEAMEILKKNGIQNVYYGKTLKNVQAIQNENPK